jgi:hypothetical protein
MLGSIRTGVAAGIAVLVGIAGLSYVLAASAAPPGGTTAAVEFTPDGKMKRPEGYREWIYIGTPLTPNDMNGGDAPFPEFHAVYIDRESFARFKKTGEFRDGTVLVKDLVIPRRDRAGQGSGQRRVEGGAQRQGLLRGRLQRHGRVDQGFEAVQG